MINADGKIGEIAVKKKKNSDKEAIELNVPIPVKYEVILVIILSLSQSGLCIHFLGCILRMLLTASDIHLGLITSTSIA